MAVYYWIFILPFAYHAASAYHSELLEFAWKSCGDHSDPIKVGDLNVYQNDSSYLYANGKFKVAFNMSAPISGDVTLKKNVIGIWVEVPCLDGAGTCTYPDVCALSPYKTDCPKYYTDRNLPCRCPLLEGKYAFDDFPIDLRGLPNWLEVGLYSIKIVLSQRGMRLICLNMTGKIHCSYNTVLSVKLKVFALCTIIQLYSTVSHGITKSLLFLYVTALIILHDSSKME